MRLSRVPVYLKEKAKQESEIIAQALGLSRSRFIAGTLDLFLRNSHGFSTEEIRSILAQEPTQSVFSSWWYRELTDNAPVMIWVSGLDKGRTYFNKAWLEFTGHELPSLLGSGWTKDVHPDDAERCWQIYSSAFDAKACFDIEYRLRRHDGEYRWLIDTAVPNFDANGSFTGYIGSCIDITPRKLAEASMSFAATSIDLLDDGVMVTDPNYTILWVNPAFTKITGYALEEIRGNRPSILSSGKHNVEFYQHMHARLATGERWQGEIWNRRKNGEIYPEWLSINVIKDAAGRVVNYVGIFSDITKQKAREDMSHYLSTHDPLTGLANRYLLEQTIELALLRSRRSKKGTAVLFVDLDSFKWINDTYGHLLGDELLKDVAEAISANIRATDLASRPGGDEFIVVLEELSSLKDAIEVAEKLSAPVQLKVDPGTAMTFSIGISYYDGDGETDVRTMIRLSDEAMYKVKRSGKNAIGVAGKSQFQ